MFALGIGRRSMKGNLYPPRPLRMANYGCILLVLIFQTSVIWDLTTVTAYERLITENAADDNYSTVLPNVAGIIEDHHIYYKSAFYSSSEKAMSFWVDLEEAPQEEVITLGLSASRYVAVAERVNASFLFPFYGHLIQTVWITNCGFIYTGEKTLRWWRLADQYIAPLMVMVRSSSPRVQYYDNGTALTVQWEGLRSYFREDVPCTFQATILQNGDIVFVYKKIPSPHLFRLVLVKHVGCQDTYQYDFEKYIRFRVKYHTVELNYLEIHNNTAIYLTALPTCLKYTDCKSCASADINFNCSWCEEIGKCSDGLNRYRQEWLMNECHAMKSDCSAVPAASPTVSCGIIIGAGEMFAIFLVVHIFIGLGIWLLYAYRNPNSPSGQLIVKHRPRKWHWNSGGES